MIVCVGMCVRVFCSCAFNNRNEICYVPEENMNFNIFLFYNLFTDKKRFEDKRKSVVQKDAQNTM